MLFGAFALAVSGRAESGLLSAMRQRFTEFEVPEALRSVSVRRLFGVEVLEVLGGVGS
jgi:hypothetical protein